MRREIKFKRIIFNAVILLVSAYLLLLTGCSIPGTQTKNQPKVLSGISADYTVPRYHQEIYDYQDRLFVTYWENTYIGPDRGTVSMNLARNGFNLTWNNYGANNIVTGKGVKPCYGDTISWKTVNKSDASFFGVYGWLKDPLVEYYIGRAGGKKDLGTYEADGKEYRLWIDETCERANILNPEDNPSLPRKFLQFNCDPTDGSGSAISPVNMAQHYAGWEKLFKEKNYIPPAGWDCHNIVMPDYCVVGVELFNGTYANGNVVVSDIKSSGICRLKFDSADNYLSAATVADYPVVAGQGLDKSWDSQKWTIETSGGYSRIKNNWSNWYLTCNAALNTTENYAEAFCQSSTGTDTQKWKILDTDGVVRVQHSSGLYLTINNGDLEGSVIICQPLHKNGSTPDWISQNWTKDTSDNTYRLKSVWGGKYVTCTGNVEGATVKAQPLNTSWDSERWSCETIDGTYNLVRFKNIRSGKYLTASSANDGALIVTKPDNGGDSQKWAVEFGSFYNTWRLKNVMSGYYLTVKSGSTYVDLFLKPIRGIGNRDVSQLFDISYFW